MKNKMKIKDPSRIAEAKSITDKDLNYRLELEKYFEESLGSNVEKLSNFCKYVPRQNLTYFLAKNELFKMVLDVQGSIVECGVLFGGGLMSWAQLSAIYEPINHQRRIVGFDTFEGFTSFAKEDANSTSDFAKEGMLAVDSYDDIKRCIKLYDANRFLNHIPKVQIVKGDINQTVENFLKDNSHFVVSLLYLDVDIFRPTAAAIRHFLPRMPKGAIIAFDQLNAKNWPGETQALMKEIGISNLRIKRFTYDTCMSYAVIE